jgi:hypothetical protein
MERFKDASGAYTCAPCYKQAPPRPTPSAPASRPAPAPRTPEPATIPLADEEPAWLKDFKPQSLDNCPRCNALKSPGVTACLQCGHDTAPTPKREVKTKLKAPRQRPIDESDRVRGDSTPLFSDAFIGRSLIVGVIAVIIGFVVFAQNHDAGKSVASAAGAFVVISIRWWIRSSIRGWFS